MSSYPSNFQLGSYLENYLESVSSLPTEITRNFSLIKELDYRTKETLELIEKYNKECLSKNCKDPDRRKQLAEKVRMAHNTCLEYADQKVSLSVQTYEMLDKHIRRLDIDLKKFEQDLENSKNEVPLEAAVGKKRKGKASVDQTRSAKKFKSRTHPLSNLKKKTEGGKGEEVKLSIEDLDMPIDPNEPTYCICKRVSFGEMVGCDNADCKVEWFHFECVGLTSTPKGKWLCPECAKLPKKKIAK